MRFIMCVIGSSQHSANVLILSTTNMSQALLTELMHFGASNSLFGCKSYFLSYFKII